MHTMTTTNNNTIRLTEVATNRITTSTTTTSPHYQQQHDNHYNTDMIVHNHHHQHQHQNVHYNNNMYNNMTSILTSSSSAAEEEDSRPRPRRRYLATLRVQENSTTTSATLDSDDRDWYSYTPSSIVSSMHHTPRFGHSNHVGLLSSSSSSWDYAQGIKQFTLFYLVVPLLILWPLLLLTFQYVYGVGKVGCAAGGQVLDMYTLSKPPYQLSRKQRQQRIQRSWRVQSAFLLASISLPVVSFVMMTMGLPEFTTSINELQEWVQDVDMVAFRGYAALQGIQTTQQTLLNGDGEDGNSANPLIQGIIEYHHQKHSNSSSSASEYYPSMATSSNVNAEEENEEDEQIDKFLQQHHQEEPTPPLLPSQQQQQQQQYDNDNITTTTTTTSSAATTMNMHGIFVDTWCPGAMTYSNELDFLIDAMETLEQNTNAILQVLFDPLILQQQQQQQQPASSSTILTDATSYFQVVTDTTTYMESTLAWFLDHDWLLKFLIMTLNVVNLFLLLNVYLLSKNNIIHTPTRRYVAYILVPAFCILTFLTTVVTMLLGIAAQVNADFCAGGPRPGSIQGTLQDAILSILQYGNVDPTLYRPLNASIPTLQAASHVAPLDMAYASIEYYATGCFSANPLLFIDTLASHMDAAVAHVNQLSTILPQDNHTISTLNDACGRDMAFLFPALHDLNQQLSILHTHMENLADAASCHQISPLFRRLSHGAMCLETPHSLTVLWSCSLVLCILCMVMLTTRAALYNAVRRKKPRDKKPRRVVEKEFSEYQEFMGKYYHDTDAWKLDDPLPQYDKPIIINNHNNKSKATQICLEFDDALQSKPTFETTPSSTPTSSGENDDLDGDEDGIAKRRGAAAAARLEAASEIGGIHQSVDVSKLWDDDSDSYGSEYDSEISDDESINNNESDEDGHSMDDEQSAVMSFLSETRSIARQTLHSLQKIKPLLLASINPMLAPRHESNQQNDYDENEDDDDFLFRNEEIGGHGNVVKDVESSVCEDSMYLTTESMSGPPSTPGLHPKPKSMLGGGNDTKEDDKEDDNESTESATNMGYANPYFKKQDHRRQPKRPTGHDDGLLKKENNNDNSKAGWFGRSVRHRQTAAGKKSAGSNHKSKAASAFDGPRLLEVLTPSSVISALTPLAPNKPFSFLYRTKSEKEVFSDMYTDANGNGGDGVFEDSNGSDEENEAVGGIKPPTTPHRDGMSVFSLSPGVASIRPTKLEMSPLLTPVELKRRRPTIRSRSRSRPRMEEPPERTPPKYAGTTRGTIRARRLVDYGQSSGAAASNTEPTKSSARPTTSVQDLVRRYDRPKKEVVSVRRKTSAPSSSSFPRNKNGGNNNNSR